MSLRFVLFNNTIDGVLREASDERVDAFGATIFARHHFGSGISVDAQVPTTFVRATGVDDEKQSLAGFGDIRLALRYDLAALWGAGGYRPSVVLSAGMALPTGRQGRFANVNSAVPVTVLATGRGAFAGQARVEATQFAFKWLAFKGWAGVDVPATENALGITNGFQVDYGVGAVILPLTWLQLSAQFSGLHLERAISPNSGPIVNSGGELGAAEATIGFRLSDQAHLTVGARTPVFAFLNGTQVAETFSVFTSISATFGVEEEDEHDHGGEDQHDHGAEDEHDHAGEDKHDHAGEDKHDHAGEDKHDDGGTEIVTPAKEAGDVVDAARDGESFVIADVVKPGRVTVIDFWAVWCEPCKDVDARLKTLAAKYPDLAVRKVEVPTFDTAVAQEHIPRVPGLPVVWIYDRDQKRVLALESADLEAMNETLRGLLEPKAEPALVVTP